MTPGAGGVWRPRPGRFRARPGAARLNPTDEMLLGAERALGSSRVVQVLWRLPAPVSPEALREEWHRLDRGRLSRRPAPARIPGGRRTWVPAHNTEPPRHRAEALTDDTVPDWLDEQVRAPLPAGSSALWRLAAAPYGAGSLVSLTVPHFRSDGLGIFTALGEEGPVPAGHAGRAPGAAARELAGWAARTLADREERARLVSALRAAPKPAGPGSDPRFFTTAFFDLDAAAWEERARAHGGTANSLFVEIAANLVRARVPRAGRAPLRVGVPVNLRRGPADLRANALVVVPLAVPAGEPQHTDLRRTRLETKAALEGSGEHSTTLVPEPLWHLLPGRYAGRLKAPGSQATDVVASNFGELPEGVARFAGQRADRTALRTMNVPGVVPERAGLRASLCLVRAGERLTVTVTGMPDHFGDARSLRGAVTEEFAAWGLRAEAWWAG
ncbi:hypothetical protein SMD11_2646 [Streptomyces albireticuli]|uniref:Condensation domain-containing protein n=1 Tax=Streptomyces albireticuli TaxID=1940 RepID=A0A1Z2L1Y2_9ACTN|nr:hypothetical protein [Streptomyces albireticuli]ARZ68295.1 hypothetical protein SMD11_2646 [Streptomyces albireticuli]